MQRLHKLSRRVDRHSKTCRDCNSTCSQEIQGQTGSLHQTNAIAKPGIRLCPHGSLCDPQKALLVRVLCYAKYHSRFGEKYRRSPANGKQERTCFSSERKKRLFLFQGKERGRSFCNVTKGTKSTEKGRRLPLPFSNPSPLTNGNRTNLNVKTSPQWLELRTGTGCLWPGPAPHRRER